nr:PREDICTED: uncharacterized protein LOC106706374 [Latimeria chalumnae]|eukprot:XP_014352724.1 PREDICTED: uncharacterized protein LOC106706374 [Latimeria chalumnae]
MAGVSDGGGPGTRYWRPRDVDHLEELTKACVNLGRLAVANSCSQASTTLEKECEEGSLLQIFRVREQVKQQCMEFQTANEACEEADSQPIPKEKLVETVEDLEEDLEKAQLSSQNKTIILHRIQLTQAIIDKLTENDNESK